MPLCSIETLWRTIGFAAMIVAVCGCSDSDPIETYRVAKPVGPVRPSGGIEAPPGEPTHRMLAATVIEGDRAWFFKVVGPPKGVTDVENSFRSLIGSVTVTGGTAAWKLPDGWVNAADRPMRLATLKTGGDPGALEVSVTQLPIRHPDQQQYLLDNVNRWRRQMSLPPIGAAELSESLEPIPTGDSPAWLAQLTGRMSARGPSGPMMRDPHAGLPGFAPATNSDSDQVPNR